MFETLTGTTTLSHNRPLSWALELESHHQVQFSVIPWRLVESSFMCDRKGGPLTGNWYFLPKTYLCILFPVRLDNFKIYWNFKNLVVSYASLQGTQSSYFMSHQQEINLKRYLLEMECQKCCNISNVRLNSAAPADFARIVNVTNYTGPWDAELISLAWNMALKSTWPCLIIWT